MSAGFVDCPVCGGVGGTTETRPTCCGAIAEYGYCKADCCVPEQVDVACHVCAGSGQITMQKGTTDA